METTTEASVPASNARVVRLEEVPVAEARFLLSHALGQEGFAVISEIDLSESLPRGRQEPRSPYFVFDVSHPKLAAEALALTPEGGLLLPCRICLWQEDEDVVVASLPASRVVEALHYPALITLAHEIEDCLERAFDRMIGPQPAAFAITAGPHHDATLRLNAEERAVLRDAAQQHMRALLREAAGTESHTLQHAIAKNIDQLEAVARKLGNAPSNA